MSAEFIMLLLAILLGAAVQTGIGIGFSIVVAPPMMILLGTTSAVPVLLMLNTLVSAVAVEPDLWRREAALIRRSILGCLIGIVLGLVAYPLLSEAAVLSLTASLLLLGLGASFLPARMALDGRGLLPVSALSGLATVWAATPGPLMVLGLLALGRAAGEVRRLVQPVALVAYGTAFALHCLSDWRGFATAPGLAEYSLAAVAGAALGRIAGPGLPARGTEIAIRVISVVASIALIRRAYLMG